MSEDPIIDALSEAMEKWRGKEVLIDDLRVDLERASGGGIVTIQYSVDQAVVAKVVANGKAYVVRLND